MSSIVSSNNHGIHSYRLPLVQVLLRIHVGTWVRTWILRCLYCITMYHLELHVFSFHNNIAIHVTIANVIAEVVVNIVIPIFYILYKNFQTPWDVRSSVFKNLEVGSAIIKDRLEGFDDSDAKTVITSKSFRGLNIRKRDRRKIKQNLFKQSRILFYSYGVNNLF